MSAAAISVVIPTHCHRDLILETLESVFAQTAPPGEIIVVDDASSDGTADLLAPLAAQGRIRVLRQARAGVAGARNAGIAAASGDLIALLDDDDLWPADKLEWQREWLAAHPDVGIVAGRAAFFHPTTGLEAPRPTPVGLLGIEQLLIDIPIFSPGQLLIRRRVFDQVGLLDASLPGTDDLDFLLRCAGPVGIAMEPRTALHYRRHAGSTSADAAHMLHQSRRMIVKNTAHLPGSRRRDLRSRAMAIALDYHGPQAIRQAKRRLRHGPDRWQGIRSLGRVGACAGCCWTRPAVLAPLLRELLPERLRSVRSDRAD